MSIFFYQGPLTHQKEQAFQKLFWELYDANSYEKTTILTDHPQKVQQINSLLLLENQSIPLIGNVTQTIDDYLFDLLKKNLHGIHQAETSLAHTLLFLIIENYFQDLQFSGQHLINFINELYTLFIQTKKYGLTEKNIQKAFHNQIDPIIINIFSEYNLWLHKKNYYDEGDIYCETLKLLCQNKLKLSDKIQNIIFYSVYPLSQGLINIITLIKNNFPNLHLHIFYEEEHGRESDLLETSFLEIGNLADKTIDFDSYDTFQEIPLYSYENPGQEIVSCLDEVCKAIQNQSLSPQNIAIICPPEYMNYICKGLEQRHIPFRLQKTQPFSKFKNRLSDNSHQIPSENYNFEIVLQKSAEKNLQTLSETITYHYSLFEDLSKNVSEELKQEFFEEYYKQQSFFTKGSNKQIVIGSYENLPLYQDRFVFILGFCLENFSVQNDSHIIPQALLHQKEYAELLNIPAYKQKILIHHFKSYFHKNSFGLYISSPTQDFSGKLLTKWDEEVFHTHFHETKVIQKTINRSSTHHNFSRQDKDIYSITEIQSYLKCPYQYYYDKVIKAPRPEDEDSLELQNNQKGSLLHSIFEELIKNHLDEYKKQIFQEKLDHSFKDLVQNVIKNKIESIDLQNKQQDITTQFYADRVYKTVLQFILKEQDWHNNEKKQSLPNKAEWKIQDRNGNPYYVLKNKNQTYKINGRVDRIDIHEQTNHFSIIDYKSGTAPGNSNILRGEDIQIPFYIMAVEELLLPSYQPSAGLYISLKELKTSGLFFKETCDEGLIRNKKKNFDRQAWLEFKDQTKQTILSTIKKIQEGLFEPNPLEQSHCQFCHLRETCGYYKNI